MQRPVVEVEDEMAVRIPEEVGAKAVADKAKTANAATMRGVREIMVGVSRIRSHRPRSILCARVVEDTMCRMTHDEDRSAIAQFAARLRLLACPSSATRRAMMRLPDDGTEVHMSCERYGRVGYIAGNMRVLACSIS